MIRGVGVVGAGAVFVEHVSALQAMADRLRLVAVAEVDPNRRRGATDTAFVPFVTDDHRALLDRPEVDVVVVCTPPRDHERIIGDALAAGKYVVCEKPLAPNLAAIDRLVDLSVAAPGRLSTVYQWRYRPEIRRMMHLVAAGRLGPLVLGRFQRLARIPAGHRGPGWWGAWDVAGGGAVMTQAIHEVDLMLQLFGDAVEVSAEMSTLCLDIESEDTCVATVRFASGAMAALFVSVATHESSTQIDVTGRDASAHFPWGISATDARVRRQLLAESAAAVPIRTPPSELVRLRRRVGRVVPRLRLPDAPSTHVGYWIAIADALDAETALPIGPSDARRSVELVTAVYSSALLQRPVPLPLVGGARHHGGVTKVEYDGHEHRSDVLARSSSAL